MHPDGTLLERLRQVQGLAAPSADAGANATLRSIQANLHRLLASRQGDARAQPDYGLPSATEIAQQYPESASALQRTIRQCIERYEPRLKDVAVSHIVDEDDPTAIRFQITARLNVPGSDQLLNFISQIDPSGRLSVRA